MTKFGFFTAAAVFVSTSAFADCDDKAFQRIRDQMAVVAADDATEQARITADAALRPQGATQTPQEKERDELAAALHAYATALQAYQAAYATICYAN